ncbi:hypothetical protein GCM10010515_17870 [Streptomyces fructofermentans]|uniref:Uncharacterized protein n=1 Tax=Streptomyces fructofermentans TaxID=152141 RepID=A0A918N8I7_9ACTN|nr:hypothetical protein GCM10010515_17870 [Streptomyces fructofermentans]
MGPPPARGAGAGSVEVGPAVREGARCAPADGPDWHGSSADGGERGGSAGEFGPAMVNRQARWGVRLWLWLWLWLWLRAPERGVGRSADGPGPWFRLRRVAGGPRP